MSQLMVSFVHIDEMDEERCISRFIWDLPDEKAAHAQAQTIIRQVIMEAEDGLDCQLEEHDVHVLVEPLNKFLTGYLNMGKRKQRLYENVEKYKFVQEGATVLWNDPDDGACSGPKVVKSCTYYYDEDSTVLLMNEDGSGETEAYYSELDPYKET